MNEQPQSELALPGASWRDGRWLLLLLVIASGMRVWQVWHTEVTTRDSVVFIRLAWRLEHESWAQVLRSGEHHPGYPFTIFLMARAVRPFFPADLPFAMQLSAQLASCLASVLLVLPMFYLGKTLFDSRVGFWGTLLFQCLPESGLLMADGLSEPLFLLLAATALLAACKALASGRWHWFALTGLASGLAYLTRTEGLLIALVTGSLLVAFQLSTRWRRPRQILWAESIALVVGVLIVAAPFMLLIGGISRKASFEHMFQREGWKQPARAACVACPLPLASWNIGPDITPDHRRLWAAWKVLAALDSAFFHVLDLPVALGLWLFRRRFSYVPGLWLLLVTGLSLTGLVYWLGVSAGYIGGRHVLLIVLGGVFWAVVGIAGLAGCLGGQRLALALLVALTLAPLGKTLSPLHGERAGFRQAGEWLARHAQPQDRILDPFSWARYHAGREFRTAEQRPDAPAPVAWVVIDRSRSKHSHIWYLVEPANQIAAQGELVKRFEVRRGKYQGAVEVYRVPLRLVPAHGLHPSLG